MLLYGGCICDRCVCVYMTCVYAGAPTCWRTEVSSRCLPLFLSTSFFETESLTEPRAHPLIRRGRPENSRNPPVSAATVFYRDVRDLNSDPHTCTPSSLAAKSSPPIPLFIYIVFRNNLCCLLNIFPARASLLLTLPFFTLLVPLISFVPQHRSTSFI